LTRGPHWMRTRAACRPPVAHPWPRPSCWRWRRPTCSHGWGSQWQKFTPLQRCFCFAALLITMQVLAMDWWQVFISQRHIINWFTQNNMNTAAVLTSGIAPKCCWLSIIPINKSPNSSFSGITGGSPPVLKRSLGAMAFSFSCLYWCFSAGLLKNTIEIVLPVLYDVCYICAMCTEYTGPHPVILCKKKNFSFDLLNGANNT